MVLKKNLNIHSINQLLSVKAHLGTNVRLWNILNKNFIFGSRNEFLFFNLKKTIPFFRRTLHFLKKSTQNHYCILFIGSHEYVTGLICYLSLNSNQYSISKKWVGGTLTNWLKIRPYIRFLYSTTIAKIRKKFILRTEKKIQQKISQYLKMKGLLQGIESMSALPNIVIILEKDEFSYPLKEAYKLMIPIITIVNTNQSGFFIAYPFFGNDFLMDTLYFYCNLILESLKNGLYLRRLFFIKNSIPFIINIKKDRVKLNLRLSRFNTYLSTQFKLFYRLFRNYKSYSSISLFKKYSFIFQLNQKTTKKRSNKAINEPYKLLSGWRKFKLCLPVFKFIKQFQVVPIFIRTNHSAFCRIKVKAKRKAKGKPIGKANTKNDILVKVTQFTKRKIYQFICVNKIWKQWDNSKKTYVDYIMSPPSRTLKLSEHWNKHINASNTSIITNYVFQDGIKTKPIKAKRIVIGYNYKKFYHLKLTKSLLKNKKFKKYLILKKNLFKLKSKKLFKILGSTRFFRLKKKRFFKLKKKRFFKFKKKRFLKKKTIPQLFSPVLTSKGIIKKIKKPKKLQPPGFFFKKRKLKALQDTLKKIKKEKQRLKNINIKSKKSYFKNLFDVKSKGQNFKSFNKKTNKKKHIPKK